MESRTPSPSSATTTVGCSHQIAHQPSASRVLPLIGSSLHGDNPGKADEDNLPDSGYGSHDSSQMATPNRTGAGDSYSTDVATGHELRLSKTKKTTAFDCKIDEVYAARFYNIQPSVESLLVQYTSRKSLLRGVSRHKPMAIRLMFLGNTIRDATPHIVVFCAPEMRKRIQHFFDTDKLVRAFYKPEDALLPSFEVAVCGCAPQLRTDNLDVGIVWELDLPGSEAMSNSSEPHSTLKRSKFNNTLCGTPIQFDANGKQKNTTLGGLVKVTNIDGSYTIMGLTAGHAAALCLQGDDDGELAAEEENESSVDEVSSECSDTDGHESAVLDEDEMPDKHITTMSDGENLGPWVFKNSLLELTPVTLPLALVHALKGGNLGKTGPLSFLTGH